MTDLLIVIIIFAAYVVEGLTGFGGAIIALPFLSLVLGLNNSVTLILMVSSFFGFYILLKKRGDVDWKQYARMIGFMAIGLPIGVLMGRYLPQDILKLALGAFTLFAGVRGLWLKGGAKMLSAFVMRLCLVGGGVLQGAFATGGPLVIVYAKAMIPEKDRFRATLICVWLTLNITLLAVRWQTNQFGSVGGVIGFALVAWAAGILVGSHICRKVNAAQFEKIVYWILFCSGVFMILQATVL